MNDPDEKVQRDRLINWKRELERELSDNILPFWIKYAPDRQHGGFVGHIAHPNRIEEKAEKGAVMHARILWTFSAAYRYKRDEVFLEMAERASDYIRQYFLDKEFGGIFWSVDYRGNPSADRKQVYAIAFMIYAFSEYYMATGDQKSLELSIQLFREIEEHALDRDRNGYTEALSREWKIIDDVRLSEKDANERKTMNTHLHIMEAYTNLYRIWKDPGLEKALYNIILIFINHFIDSKSWHLNLFFDDDWNNRTDFISFGHDIECSWLIQEAAEVLGRKNLPAISEKAAVNMARANLKGLDKDGGLSYEYFMDDKHWDREKHWWPQAEAMVGYLNACQLSGEPVFLWKSMEIWHFIKDHLIDHEYGEWYWSVDREGRPDTTREKAGFWKCPYHNSRACLEVMDRIDRILTV